MRKSHNYSPSYLPSAIQIRVGGAKGILFHDPRLEGDIICLRKSQEKFMAPNVRTLDIAGTSARPIPMFLNRPLIALLEHLGVDESVFLELQVGAITAVRNIKKSFGYASAMFSQHGLGSSFRLPSLMKNMTEILGIEVPPVAEDDLFHSSLTFGSIHLLREIKFRAHIRVEGSYTLIGVSDEWDCLEEGEIYAHVYDPRNGIDEPISGKLLITRSPQIHPGDAQYVHAIGTVRPEIQEKLGHLKNVVVFSCR
jgi:RNA-dependent RNA polymerase